MATKAKLPKKFTMELYNGHASELGGPVNPNTPALLVFPLLGLPLDSRHGSFKGAISYKDGVTDPFDGQTARMWTITIKVTPEYAPPLYDLIATLDRIKTHILSFAFEVPVGAEALAAYRQYQFVHVFYKRLSEKAMAFKGRQEPRPGRVPAWVDVHNF